MAPTTQVQPVPPSPARRSSSSTTSLAHDSFELTVEWSGRYSVDKTLALFAAAQQPDPRIALWLALTPVASLVIPLLVELIPLNNPFMGWQHNWPFFLRFALRSALMNFSIDSQIDTYIPEQRLPRHALVLMNLIQSATSACAVVLVSALAGVFPIPFVIITAAPFHAVVSWSMRSVFVRMQLPVERDPVCIQRIQQRLPQVMRLINFSLPLLYIYSVFAVAFATVPEDYQVAMAVALQLVKLLVTRYQWRLSHIGGRHESEALDGSEDLATAHVASGARFFHALFTTTCLQKSKSSMTLVVVVFFSVVQEVGTIRGLRNRERRLLFASTQLNGTGKDTGHEAGFQETLAGIAKRASAFDRQSRSSLGPSRPLTRSKSFYSSFHADGNVLVNQRDNPLGTSRSRQAPRPLTPDETAFLSCSTRLLHCQEAALLRLYVEIFVPVLYLVYVTLAQYTPNIEFLPTLQLSDSHNLTTLAQRLAVQVAVKILTLVFILHRHCREPGGLRQLAFAVSSLRSVMLSYCVLNALCVFDFPLLHNGHDFTFQFKWLRHHHT